MGRITAISRRNCGYFTGEIEINIAIMNSIQVQYVCKIEPIISESLT